MTEKLLEDYDDVFADIINVLLFDGKQVVKPGELQAGQLHSQYKADDGTELKHVDEVLKLLSIMANDRRYEEIRVESEKGSVNSMCEVADRLWNSGRKEGKIEGENLLARLIDKLLEAGRITDIKGAAKSAEIRQELYKEFGMV